ncbi:MAG TPA: protein translocase subunit SecD, partial [Deltaproteobacteria bacterium]|nr:protein translocase subunit SecD [Deltaproteobacteria bacterium]
MRTWLKVRLILTLVVLAGALLFLLPTFLGEIPEGWPSFLPMEKVRLGLDLQGGMHLLLEVEAEEAVKSTLERIKNDLKDDLRKRKVFFTRLERVGDGIEVVLLNEEMKPPFQALLETKYAALKVKEEGREGDRVRVVLMLDPRTAQEIKKWAVEQALETIRNRVDQFGVAEPEIARQGTDRILVQLP